MLSIMSSESGIGGYNYFQNLPDEILILIFTKVICVDKRVDTLRDIISLIQCSAVCKQFNSLFFQIPTLSLVHPSIPVLYRFCPIFLKIFKHIRYLLVLYQSDTEGIKPDIAHLPHIFSKAVYDPHSNNYRLAVFTSTDIHQYSGQLEINPTRTIRTATESEHAINYATQCYASYLFHLHHMLFSSIREHKFLQKVLVTDLLEQETFTLVEEHLAELRDAGTTLAQVQGCRRSGFYDMFTMPYLQDVQLVFRNVSFSLFEKWEGSTHPNTDIPTFEGKGKVLQEALETMLHPGMEACTFRDYEIVPRILSKNNWH